MALLHHTWAKQKSAVLTVEQAVLEDQRMKKRIRMGVGCRLLGIPVQERGR